MTLAAYPRYVSPSPLFLATLLWFSFPLVGMAPRGPVVVDLCSTVERGYTAVSYLSFMDDGVGRTVALIRNRKSSLKQSSVVVFYIALCV